MTDPILEDTPVVNTPTKFILLIATLMSLTMFAVAENTGGLQAVGDTAASNPVQVGGVAYPSPRTSPVAQNKVDRIGTDGLGNLMVKVSSAITSSISNLYTTDYDTSGATNTVAATGLLVPSSSGPVAVTGDGSNGLDVDVTRISGNAIYVDSGLIGVTGQAPHDAAVVGNPILTGGYAWNAGSLPSAVSTSGDVARFLVDAFGRQRVSLEDAAGVGQSAHGAAVRCEASLTAARAAWEPGKGRSPSGSA